MHHHCIRSICIFRFPPFGVVGRMLALIVLVPWSLLRLYLTYKLKGEQHVQNDTDQQLLGE